MNSRKLEKAREYEKKSAQAITDGQRPMFHVTPNTGWANDPNGFSYYRGEAHLFYQYHPYSLKWGPMHWGHMKTRDFIRWERLPAAMAPDEEYDRDGCFSGSAIELPDGRHMLMYTAVREWEENGAMQCRQTQCIAYGDGVDYVKYEGNPVLDETDLPEGNDRTDFRDPKVWYEKDEEKYYAVVGSRTADGSGAVLLFSSADTRNWEYAATLECSRNEYGRMWECPDFFHLDGRDVIIVSPQEMKAHGLEFHNGNDVICIMGSYDRAKRRFARESVSALDYGLDFYAPQTLQTPDGRRIMIAWMQSWETSAFTPDDAKWFGMQTLPRELSVKGKRLLQNPVRELEGYRKNKTVYLNETIQEKTVFPGVKGRTVDMSVKVHGDTAKKCQKVVINLAENCEYRTSLIYRPQEHTLEIDRTDSGFYYNIVERRKAPVRDTGGGMELRIVMDRFSIEVFVNGGEQVMSSVIYTPQQADGISFEAKGEAVIDVEKHDIRV